MLLSQVKCCLLTSSGFLTHLQSAGRPADSSQKDSEGLDKICGERCSPCTHTHNSKSKQASTTNSFFYPNCSTERSSSISNIASATGTSRIHGGCSKLSIPERWQKPCSHWKRKYIYICTYAVEWWINGRIWFSHRRQSCWMLLQEFSSDFDLEGWEPNWGTSLIYPAAVRVW